MGNVTLVGTYACTLQNTSRFTYPGLSHMYVLGCEFEHAGMLYTYVYVMHMYIWLQTKPAQRSGN